MLFHQELERVLPADIPYREQLIEKSAKHLELIITANAYMNLTRITTPEEAAIKHILDSVSAWHFFEGADRVLDAGTGAGFPGIPLAVVLPHVRFTLSESIQKKARFVDSAVEALDLPNVQVTSERAEDLASKRAMDIITARAVAPIGRLLELFDKAVKQGARLLLYKGPDVDLELAEAKKHRMHARVLHRYELPDQLGARTLVEIHAQDLTRKAS